MRLLLAGGGTGGHLFPAIALAEQLKHEDPQSEVLFVGTERGLEARMLPELGWTLKTIEMSGWAGSWLACPSASSRQAGEELQAVENDSSGISTGCCRWCRWLCFRSRVAGGQNIKNPVPGS